MSQSEKITIIQSQNQWFHLNLNELWQYRELLLFLSWRNISIRYKQSLIGFGWAIFQPLVTMVVFTFVFGNFLGVSSDGVPYAPFALAALVPWRYFSAVLIQGSNSLVQNAQLVTKVYFPRLILPLVSIIDALVDLMIAMVILLIVILAFGIVPTFKIILLPVFLALAIVTALSVTLWTAALNVRYRDIGQAIPFVVQVWMYLSPVVYSVSSIPQNWRFVFRLNPMTTVIDGFRWVLLDTQQPDTGLIAVSILMVSFLLLGGLAYFNITQREFADVI